MARPSSYKTVIPQAIVADVAAGVPKTSAFAGNGVCERTGFYWQRRHPAFSRALARAQVRYNRRVSRLLPTR